MPNALRKEPTFLNEYASIAGTDDGHHHQGQAGSSLAMSITPSVIQRSNVIVTRRRGHEYDAGGVVGHYESMPTAGGGGTVPLPVTGGPIPPTMPGSSRGSLKTDLDGEGGGAIISDPGKSSTANPKFKKVVTPFVCEHCNRSFRHKSYFDYHLRTHTGERPHQCSICERAFFERSKLNRHLTSCHSVRNPFSDIEGEDGGEGKPPFTCDICQKTFARNSGLQVHLQVHQGIRPYPCQTCGKRFSGLTALKNHEKGHEGAKDILCEICGKAFLLKKYLDLHLSTTHRQQRRDHKCPRCRKDFHSVKDLRRHQLIHTKERNFKCQICSTSFKRKDNLNRHLRLSHSLSPEQYNGDEASLTGGSRSLAETVTENTSTSRSPRSEPVLPPVPITRQVSVIKSTHEVIMSMSKGRGQR